MGAEGWDEHLQPGSPEPTPGDHSHILSIIPTGCLRWSCTDGIFLNADDFGNLPYRHFLNKGRVIGQLMRH